MKTDEFGEQLIKKLDELGMKIDALIQVVAITSRKETMLKGKTKTDQIILLSDLGLPRTIVAWIVGTTPEAVSVRLSQIKSKEKKKTRKAEKESDEKERA
ncbi:MAG: hypothetical protein OEY95_04445 [Candidatus Bathyarchaeota archaeon]|nr:hypothetical protein [Candidatus Bathyarchaeota archaeon]